MQHPSLLVAVVEIEHGANVSGVIPPWFSTSHSIPCSRFVRISSGRSRVPSMTGLPPRFPGTASIRAHLVQSMCSMIAA